MDLTELPSYVKNHNLFQSYYLKNRLTLKIDESEKKTQRITLDQVKQVQTRITELWDEKGERLKEGEDNVIDFAKRVCEYLGMHQSGQGNVPRIGASPQRVDITLFSNVAALDRFVATKKRLKTHTSNTASRYTEALTVVEAEPLNANLDKSQHDNKNPSYQITNYLTLTGLQWGILTDGVRWRIYHRFDPPRFDVYFEVNLQKILEISEDQERFEAFLWFYKFFSLSAFDSFNKEAFLGSVLTGSDKYAVEVQENLRNQAFSVVQKLAQGIATNYTSPLSDKDINIIYNAAIIILYRLLFIKYAEDMAILPVTNPNYQRIYGFSKLQDELLDRLDDPKVKLGDNPNDTSYWQILSSFFEAIDKGKPSADIRGYNGSLFKPDRLASIRIPDLYLAETVDQLARVEIYNRLLPQ